MFIPYIYIFAFNIVTFVIIYLILFCCVLFRSLSDALSVYLFVPGMRRSRSWECLQYIVVPGGPPGKRRGKRLYPCVITLFRNVPTCIHGLFCFDFILSPDLCLLVCPRASACRMIRLVSWLESKQGCKKANVRDVWIASKQTCA